MPAEPVAGTGSFNVHPAFPDVGIRLDPMHTFTNATEIASRIRQAFPPNMDESFANFAWMAVNAIAQGLIALEDWFPTCLHCKTREARDL